MAKTPSQPRFTEGRPSAVRSITGQLAPGPAASEPSDDGSITAFVALLLVALVALAGLVVDGGTAMSAHQAAVDEAEQAARAGAGALSVDALRDGSVVLDQDAAIQSAEAFTVASGHPGTATVSDGTVTVSVHYRVPTAVLGIVGISSLPVSATASALDLAGVTVGSP